MGAILFYIGKQDSHNGNTINSNLRTKESNRVGEMSRNWYLRGWFYSVDDETILRPLSRVLAKYHKKSSFLRRAHLAEFSPRAKLKLDFFLWRRPSLVCEILLDKVKSARH